MSRPLRIENPKVWYHVMIRGRRADRIFNDRQDCMMIVEHLLTPDALSISKRGALNDTRNVAVFLFRRLRGPQCRARDGLKEIGSWFGIQKSSSVSDASKKLKARMVINRMLKHRVNGFLEMFRRRSQGQT